MADDIREARRLAKLVWRDTGMREAATIEIAVNADDTGSCASALIEEWPWPLRAMCSVNVRAPRTPDLYKPIRDCERATRRAALAGLCGALRALAGEGK